MLIEDIVSNRLTVAAIQNSLYNITNCDIKNIKAFKIFVANSWDKLKDEDKYSIAELLASSYQRNNKNHENFKKYINKIKEKYEVC